jgi:hypothetical protein
VVRKTPAWYHFSHTKLVAEVDRIFVGSASGVQLMPEFKEAELGPDGLWLTTQSWQRLVLHLFDSLQVRASEATLSLESVHQDTSTALSNIQVTS